MKSKTKRAEEKILNALRKHKTVHSGKLTLRHPDLPITYALWSLKKRGEIKRKAWGEYQSA